MRVTELVAGVGLVVVVSAILVCQLLFGDGSLLSDEGMGGRDSGGPAMMDGRLDLNKEPARALVGIDRDVYKHGRPPLEPGDFAVVHVEEELDEFSNETGISPRTIAFGIAGAAYLFNRDHGFTVSRQQIAEDLCKAYRIGELRAVPREKFDEFIAVWVNKKYSKAKARLKGRGVPSLT